MVGASKILTVSYGTFSCTLEGFDEPFSTMKAIAEYFRDLAADDRYFGAEPPTPDAEMLSRIAEREIQRRVEAKVSEHGVVLRQTDTEVEPQVVLPAAETLPVVAAVAAVAAVAPEIVAVAAIAAPEEEIATFVEEAEADAEVDVEAVDIAPMAGVTAEAKSEMVAGPAAETEAFPEAAPDDLPETAEQDDYAISLEAIMAEAAEVDAEPEDMAAPAQDDAFAMDDFAIAIDTTADPETDSIAAKLMRIRAVVDGVRSANSASFDEDEEAPESNTATGSISDDFGFTLDLSDDVPELRAAEEARAQTRAESVKPEEPVAAAVSDARGDEAEDESEDEILELQDIAEAAPEQPENVAETSDDAQILASLSNLGMLNSAETAAEQTEEPEAEQDSFDENVEEIPAIAEAQIAEPAQEEDHPSLYQRARARVIRLSKAATLRSTEDLASKTDPDKDFGDFEDAMSETAAPDSGEAHPAFEAADAEGDADLTRLMDEAKTKLEGAETRRRFSAITQLKAAVAATLADRKMKTTEASADIAAEAETDISLYREDLSKAVRPRRQAPESPATTRRPSMEMRPTPLVLVSEQRVDRTDAPLREAAVVRPRRIATGNLAVYAEDEEDEMDDATDLSPESASSFAEFAERLGATTLTEMLEAAAAYTSSVEGRPLFSRPQILRKVEYVAEEGDFTREDGLRSFGMLLRQGKIQKVSRGQFAIADTSKFMSEARRAR